MLASVVRSSRLQARTLSTAAAKATPAKTAPMASATVATATEMPSASRGELAWCEIYGMDYEKMLLEAQDESPIALNDPRVATSAVHAPRAANEDIWSVVFGTTK